MLMHVFMHPRPHPPSLAYVCLCMYSSQLLCLWPCTVQYAVNLHFLLLITYREHLGLVDDYQVSDSECFDPLSDAFYKVSTVLQNAIILRKVCTYVLCLNCHRICGRRLLI